MATKHVQSDALNLRSTPQVQTGNVIAVLVKGQPVSTIGAADGAGWINVDAVVNGATLRGFLKADLLRDPVSQAKERLISGAVAEWVRFDKGSGQENVAPFFR